MKSEHKYLIAILSLLITIFSLVVFIYPSVFAAKAWPELTQIQTNFPLEIVFNQPMLRESVEKSLVIDPPIMIKLAWSNTNQRLTILPQGVLEEDRVYRVSLKKARSFIGTIIQDNVFDFRTESKKINPHNLPQAKDTEKWLEIDLSRQTLKMWQDGKILQEYLVSTGKRSTPTKAGEFKVLTRLKEAYGCGDGQCWLMPYWLGIYQAGSTENGIHELPLLFGRFREGLSSLGYPVSHGCIRLGIGPAEIVYNWTATGTPVIIHY